MAIPDADILTNLLLQFQSVISASSGVVRGYAIKVLLTVGMIDFLIVVLLSLMDENNHPLAQTLLKRTLKYGAFGFMVFSYSSIVNAISTSFTKIGLAAGGNLMTMQDFTNPSKISAMGFEKVMPNLENLINSKGPSANGTIIDVVTSLPSTLFFILILVAIMFCYFIIAINIFIIYVEFAIFVSLALILVPFGIWDKTEFIFDKVKNGVINFGIKYMALAFIVSISIKQVENWTFSGTPTLQQYLYVLIGMIAITYLCLHVPSLVAGMVGGGGGSMTAAGMAGYVAGAARNTGVTKALSKAGGAAMTAGKAAVGVAATGGIGAAATAFATVGKAAVNSVFKTGGTGGEDKSADKSNSSSPPSTPSPTSSGVDLNSGSNVADTGGSTNTDTSSNASTAKTAGPTTTQPSGVDIASQTQANPGTPSIKPSGINLPPSAPNTTAKTDLK